MAKLRAPWRRRRRSKKPRLLLCTPEVTELPEGMGNAANFVRVKGGGLGDISASLIRHLYDDGRYEVHVVLPRYDRKIRGLTTLTQSQVDELGPRLLRKGVHMVTDSAFSRLRDVYEEDGRRARIRRAEALQRYVVNQLLDELRPDVVHCNDWMTGLIPAAARERGIKSIFTIHNVFTEHETPENIDRGGLDVRRFMEWLYFEWFPADLEDTWKRNRVDFAASGVLAADVVNTVSPTFLEEIVSGAFADIVPKSIRQSLREKHASGRAHGILNAPGDDVIPERMRGITSFDVEGVARGKAENKSVFQAKMGLREDPTLPLFFWPSRLYEQKSPDLLVKAFDGSLGSLPGQLAVVANGNEDTVRALKALARKHAGRIAYASFDEGLSNLGKAGSDFVVMPSRYEPCGLPQMECPRFGTLPVVRKTGGLSDTVQELDVAAGQGNGFVFSERTPAAFGAALRRAVDFLKLPEAVRVANLQRVMRESRERFSLEVTAKTYMEHYERLIADA